MLNIDGKDFDLSDFERSNTASKNHINNHMSLEDQKDYQYLIDNVLYPIRREYNRDIYVTSGYRCKQLNTLVGGVSNSQHRSIGDEAASDITTNNRTENKILFELIVRLIQERKIIVDQLINEKNYSWIHISVKRVGYNRNQIIR